MPRKKPPVESQETYVVAEGKSLECARGRLVAGQVVLPKYVGGAERLLQLASAGSVKIQKQKKRHKSEPPADPPASESDSKAKD